MLRRNKREALKSLKKSLKKYPKPQKIITDKLKPYKATLRDLNMDYLQEAQRYKNNQIENSHLHLRRREKIMNTQD